MNPKKIVLALGMLISLLALTPAMAKNQAAIVSGEISAFAKHLSLNPNIAIDFTKVSGEYCFNMGMGKGGHMTHYATDPTSTKEDVIDFVNAQPLLDAGVSLANLPPLPKKLGAMKPNQWYFLAAKQYEPHHGKKFPFPIMIRASNHK